MAIPTVDLPNAETPQDRGERQQVLIGSRAIRPLSIFGFIFLVILTLYFLIPVYWLVVNATKNNPDLFGSFGLWFANWNFITNVQGLATHQNGIYFRWIANTVLYAVVGGAASTLISVMAGYALAKYRFRGRAIVTGMVLSSILVPITTLALPIYLLESKLSLVNTYWAVLLPVLLSPLGVFLARVYSTAAIPDALIDAARVDGAGEFRTFFSVAIPILMPGMVTIFLFQFVNVWNSFFLPLIVLTDPNYFPVNLGLQTWNFDPSSHEVIYNLIVTGSFLAVLPVIVLFLFLQRYWRSGLTFGSVTG